MINVLIVDNHDIIREGLKKILSNESDIKVIGEARNWSEMLQKISFCDIVLMDMDLQNKKSIEIINDLKKAAPKVRILALSIYPEDKLALRILKAGASGYLCKDTALEELVDAIRRINTRGRYLSIALAEQLALDIMPQRETLPHDQLSNRELETMFMLASGKKVKDIASELTLSVSTVFTYRFRIFEKLNINNNVELTHYAIVNDLIDLKKN
jgi:DNA-binding NarL/FixJ family response regulator